MNSRKIKNKRDDKAVVKRKERRSSLHIDDLVLDSRQAKRAVKPIPKRPKK
jgi:hypothetical protein